MKIKEYTFLAILLGLGSVFCFMSYLQLLAPKPEASTSPAINSLNSLGQPTPTSDIGIDSNSSIKSDVSQVATAIEACYTYNSGSYVKCTSLSSLVSQGFMKAQPVHSVFISTKSAATDVMVYAKLQTPEACQFGSGSNVYYVYRSSIGSPNVECTTTTPSLNDAPTYTYPTPYK